MLEIIAAAVMISFGLLAIYFSLENRDNGDKDLIIALILGFTALIGGAWIILTRLTLAIILTKLAGLILFGLGLFLIFGYPDIGDYQKAGLSTAGIFIGIIFALIGAYLLFF